MKVRRKSLPARPLYTAEVRWNGEGCDSVLPWDELNDPSAVDEAMVRVVSESPPERVSDVRRYVQTLRGELLGRGAYAVRCDPVRVVGRRAHSVASREVLPPDEEVERWLSEHPPRGCNADDVLAAIREVMSEEGL